MNDFIFYVAPIMTFVVLGLMLTLLISLTVWVYKDAKKRNNHPILWAALTLVLNQALIGFILYLLVGRKQAKVECENCGEKIDMISKFCSFCGTIVSRNKDKEFEKNDNKFIKNIVIITVIAFGIFMVYIIGFAGFQMMKTGSEEIKLAVGQEISAKEEVGSEYSILNVESQVGGKWSKRAYRSVDTGTMEYDIKDPKTEKILVSYTQERGSAYVVLSQNSIYEEIDISNLNNYDGDPLEISLEKFEAGNIDVHVTIDARKLKFKLEKRE